MKIKPLAGIVEFLRPVADEVGVELVDAEWNERERALTLFIDAEGGIDLNKCEAFHRAVDGPLDEFDPTFGEAYTLNCSSLGLDRPLKTPRDFERTLGKKVEVRLYAPEDGSKYFEGELTAYDEETVTVETAGGARVFPIKKIAKMCLYIEF